MTHFVTLFNNAFLPLGLNLHASLLAQEEPFHLWVIALDLETEQALLSLKLPNISIIPLRDIETSALLKVKAERIQIEYYWTLTPFTFQAVLDRAPTVEVITYVDADLFFFNKSSIILKEFEQSGKNVLITEHAYDPIYNQSNEAGRFCVQFISIKRTSGGLKVMQWWQQRCLEWCFNRVEDGKFGDQRYLDQWPILFENDVHILNNKSRVLAPWNAEYFISQGTDDPVFYHFHGLRIVSRTTIRLSTHYRLGSMVLRWYKTYLRELNRQLLLLERHNIPLVYINPESRRILFLSRKRLKRIFQNKTEHWAFRILSGYWIPIV